MMDGVSYQIYFPNILSRFILVHYIGAIVIYTTHPKSTQMRLRGGLIYIWVLLEDTFYKGVF